MKKEIVCIGILLIGIFLISLVSAQADVAYITKRDRAVDSVFLGVFEELGLETDIILSKDIKKTDFSNYKFIFIGPEKLSNSKYIPINQVNSVIANPYYGKEFGLVIKKGVSKLVSNIKLKALKDQEIIQVYRSPSFKFLGLGLPLYYLPSSYKNPDMESIAIPITNSCRKTGDAISYSSDGPKKCFFGITETNYWTTETRELFKDCIGFVLEGQDEEPECVVDNDCGVVSNELFCDTNYLINRTTAPSCIAGICSEMITENSSYCELGCEDNECVVEEVECLLDSDCGVVSNELFCNNSDLVNRTNLPFCGEGVCGVEMVDVIEECVYGCEGGVCLEEPLEENHDVGLNADYDGFGHAIKINDPDNNPIEVDIPILDCISEYDIKFQTENLGDFVEDVNINLTIKNSTDVIYENFKIMEDLGVGLSTTTGYKNNYVFNETGDYIINVEVFINNDINLSDNTAERQIEVVC